MTMRHGLSLITFLLVAGLAVGCGSTDGESAPAPKPSAGVALEAATETKPAVRAIQDYAYVQKAEMVGQMKKDLVEIRQELDRLSVKVANSGGAAKADAKTKLEAAREKWADMNKRLDSAADSATESTWDAVKGDLQANMM
jgi:hypothetical protein